MFIKQRRVRRSAKFTSRWARTSLQRREYTASLYTMGVIQFVLVWALGYGAYQSFVMVRTQFQDTSAYKYALPGLMALIALIVLRAFIGNLRRAIEAYRRPPSSPER